MPEQQAPTLINQATEFDAQAGSSGKTMTIASVIGALAMSSCCIAPLVLFSLGVSGAWIGNLTALYPYKPLIFVVTAGFLAVGFYKVYRKPATADCTPGSYCATPVSNRITKTALWSSSILVLAAMAFPYIAPFFLYD